MVPCVGGNLGYKTLGGEVMPLMNRWVSRPFSLIPRPFIKRPGYEAKDHEIVELYRLLDCSYSTFIVLLRKFWSDKTFGETFG